MIPPYTFKSADLEADGQRISKTERGFLHLDISYGFKTPHSTYLLWPGLFLEQSTQLTGPNQ